ncbi:MAG: trypsin-like peptidase domain-containing protein [Pseudomonadales bacterium]|jgi:serine protease Do
MSSKKIVIARQRKFIAPLFFAIVTSLFSAVVFSAELPDFTTLVEKNSPAVVKIQVETGLSHHPLSPAISASKPRSEVMGLGSGFIIEPDGYILTNYHVIKDADKIVVRMSDRREFDAEVVGSDSRSDIALLKVNASGLPVLKLDTSDKLKVGEWVLAIGSPFGLDYSVSQGIVSAMGRSLPNGENENYVPFIQTDVAINPGNSGGPLFNLAGDVVGINSQIFTRTGGSMGLSFAIPASVVRNVVAQLKDKGYVARGWLGVSIQDVDRSLAASFGLSKPEGALVAQVGADSPADKAGIAAGDVITAFNGKPILFAGDLSHLVGQVSPDSAAELTLVRHGVSQNVHIVVGELSDKLANTNHSVARKAQQDGVAGGILGMQIEGLDARLAAQLRVSGGVLVRAVRRGGAAEKAGLQLGDVVVQLGFINVDDESSFRRVVNGLQAGSIQPIRFFREGRSIFRSIVIP